MRASGRTLGQVLSQLARRGLKAQNQFGSRNGLPTFGVNAISPVIPSDRATSILAEELAFVRDHGLSRAIKKNSDETSWPPPGSNSGSKRAPQIKTGAASW